VEGIVGLLYKGNTMEEIFKEFNGLMVAIEKRHEQNKDMELILLKLEFIGNLLMEMDTNERKL
jgi:hypothetical protein